MAADNMGRFMTNDAGQRIVVGTDFVEKPLVDINVAARDREGIDFRAVNDANPERHIGRFFLRLSKDRRGNIENAAVGLAIHDKLGLGVDLRSVFTPQGIFLFGVHDIVVDLATLTAGADRSQADGCPGGKGELQPVGERFRIEHKTTLSCGLTGRHRPDAASASIALAKS